MTSDRATEVWILRRYGTLGLFAMLIGVLAFAAAGCGGKQELEWERRESHGAAGVVLLAGRVQR